MSTLYAIIAWFVFGLIAGGLARLLVPGRQSMSLFMTSLLGIAGSVIGGGISWLLTGEPLQPAGWILSIIGAVIALVLIVRTQQKRPVH